MTLTLNIHEPDKTPIETPQAIAITDEAQF